MTTLEALEHLQQAMKNNPEYAYGWHSNIAMALYDTMISAKHGRKLEIANDAASRFMKSAFDIETTQDMLSGKHNGTEK